MGNSWFWLSETTSPNDLIVGRNYVFEVPHVSYSFCMNSNRLNIFSKTTGLRDLLRGIHNVCEVVCKDSLFNLVPVKNVYSRGEPLVCKHIYVLNTKIDVLIKMDNVTFTERSISGPLWAFLLIILISYIFYALNGKLYFLLKSTMLFCLKDL